MNLASIIVLLVVAALAFLAVRALRSDKRSCCDSNTKKPKDSSKCAGCTVDCPFKR